MQSLILTSKSYNLYAACSVEFGVISYGGCRDEAVNNLQDELNGLSIEAMEGSREQ